MNQRKSFTGICLFLVLAFLPISLAAQTPIDLGQEIARLVTSLEKVPNTGVAIAIVKDGKILFSHAYGYRDRRAALPATTNTLFSIGSITKTFTAASMGLLADRSLVDLQKPVHNYLPIFKLKDPVANELANSVDLMSHRTGMPRHENFWLLAPFQRADFVAHIGYLLPNRNPDLGFRKSFKYSNLMYAVLGNLIEQVSKTTWEKFVTTNFLQPLGMNSVVFNLQELSRNQDHALPYLGEASLGYVSMERVKAAGAINASVNDMARWLLFQLNDGRTPQGRPLLTKNTLNLLRQPQIHIPVPQRNLFYGMGWFIDKPDAAGPAIIWHGGNTFGYTSNMSFIPEKQLGVVVLTNQYASPLAAQLTDQIYRLLSQLKALPTYTRPLALQRFRQMQVLAPESALPGRTKKTSLFQSIKFSSGVVSPQELDGIYRDQGYGDILIRYQEGKLYMKYYSHTSELVPQGNNTFAFKFNISKLEDELPVAFQIENGKVVGLSALFEEDAGLTLFKKM